MKRWSIGIVLIALILLAVIGGAWLAPILLENPGYVLIQIGEWRVQMSVLVLVGALLLLWLAISLLVGFFRMPGRAMQTMRQASQRKHMNQGLLALSEGDWDGAERALARAMRSEPSTAGYLAAARAAQGQSALERRDEYLALADRSFGKKHFVTAFTRARLLMNEGRPEEAIRLLEPLYLKKQRHQGVLKLLLQAYQHCDRWHEVRLLIPATQKAGIVNEQRAQELMQLAIARELRAAPDLAALTQVQKGLSREQRQQTEVVAAFAERALELDRADVAEAELRRAIDYQFEPSLLPLYAQADPSDRAMRIEQAQRWLARHDDSSALHLALGQLFSGERQHNKAREHLEIAVRKSPDPAAYAALAQVLDRAGELEAATQCYRNALRMEQGRAPDPLPPPVPNNPEPAESSDR